MPAHRLYTPRAGLVQVAPKGRSDPVLGLEQVGSGAWAARPAAPFPPAPLSVGTSLPGTWGSLGRWGLQEQGRVATSSGSKPPACPALGGALTWGNEWLTPQLPVSKKKQSQKRLWRLVEAALGQGLGWAGLGCCCVQRAAASGARQVFPAPGAGGYLPSPHNCFPRREGSGQLRPAQRWEARWSRLPRRPRCKPRCQASARTPRPEAGGGAGAQGIRLGREPRGAPHSPPPLPPARASPAAPPTAGRAGAETPRETRTSASEHSKFRLLPAWPEAGLRERGPQHAPPPTPGPRGPVRRLGVGSPGGPCCRLLCSRCRVEGSRHGGHALPVRSRTPPGRAAHQEEAPRPPSHAGLGRRADAPQYGVSVWGPVPSESGREWASPPA